MASRARALTILGVTAALCGGVLYAHRLAPPSCAAPQTVDRVAEALRAQFKLGPVRVEDIRTLSDGFFGTRYECSADAADIGDSMSATDLHWRAIRYSSVRPGASPLIVVSVTIGSEVPPPAPASFWNRLRSWF